MRRGRVWGGARARVPAARHSGTDDGGRILSARGAGTRPFCNDNCDSQKCTVSHKVSVLWCIHGRGARRVQVALLNLKSMMPLQKLPESAAILVWPPVALVHTFVPERRFGSPSCSPPRPPVAGSFRTALLIAVPPSCGLSFRPFCFQAPWGPALDFNNYMVKEDLHTTMMCGQQDRTTRDLPSTKAVQLLWVLLLIVLGGPYVFDIIVISALS